MKRIVLRRTIFYSGVISGPSAVATFSAPAALLGVAVPEQVRRTGVQFWYPFCECHAVRRILVDVTTLYGLLFRSSQSDGGLAFFDVGAMPTGDGGAAVAVFPRGDTSRNGDGRTSDRDKRRE